MQDAGLLQGSFFPESFYADRTPTVVCFYLLYLAAGTIERVASTFTAKKRFDSPRSQISELWFSVPFYGYLAIVLLSAVEFFVRVQVVSIALSACGFLIYLVGVTLRRKAIAGLGDNWSLYTEIRQGHTLVTRGIYRFLKHPYYVAVICELVGACLVANAMYTAVLAVLTQLPLLLARIKLEERLLSEHFADKYAGYSKGKIL